MILIYDNGATYLIDESELYDPFPKDSEDDRNIVLDTADIVHLAGTVEKYPVVKQ